ncbi:MAG: diguanylate cyclase, partial [Pseudomonadota bacterium]|nr:diguanylate cyclase [Pseudomonadota bacterium]MDP1904605.1 diguanylate cyclase [Pseudomonadota bacterium]MDP2353196.1 diguanylate cyclase [Pseudomonadota bacterium]
MTNGQVLEQKTQPHYLEERIIGRVYTYTDTTQRRQEETDRRVAAIAFESQEAIAITDANQVILKVNQAFTRITGYSVGEAVGNNPGQLLKSGRHDAAFYREMWAHLECDRHWQGEILNRRKNGAVFPEWLTITAVMDESGQVTHYVAAFSDTSRNKKAEAEIHNLAFYDPLTELPNRRLLQDRLDHALAASARSQRFGAILLIDLDHFKELNDTKGHAIGDLLLIEVANCLRASVREEDTVARLGGDEFVVILADLGLETDQVATQAEAVAEKIRDALTQPFQLQNHEHRTSPSIGINLRLPDPGRVMAVLSGNMNGTKHERFQVAPGCSPPTEGSSGNPPFP